MKTYDNVLVTGGSGFLGSHLKKALPGAYFPTHEELEVESIGSIIQYLEDKRDNINTVFHGAAFTSPPIIDKDPLRALWVNIIGTTNMVDLCMLNKYRLIYMSTDYVFKGDKGKYKEDDPVYPVNKYAWSKLGGECAVRMYDNSLIVRTNICPDPFPYDKAFIDQWTSRDYIQNIIPKIVKLIDSAITGTIHIGGKKQRIYHLARQTKPRVEELYTSDVDFKVPRDVSLNQRRWKEWLKKQES